MSLDDVTRERIDHLIQSNHVMLFMKGNRDQPQCGFSATVIGILGTLIPDFATADVLEDQEIREGIKIYSSWPTIPQLYVKGEFIGGCDIIQELFQNGELHEALGVSLEKPTAPTIHISDTAAVKLGEALEGASSGQVIHLGVDARFQNNLSLGPVGPSDLAAESNGVTLYMDPLTAGRADGLSIDIVDTPQGQGFKLDNPSTPQVRQVTAKDLERMIDSGEHFELSDVRTPEERATASIPGSILFSEEEERRLSALPKDEAVLVFHCHHGGRSQQVAEHFAAKGFKQVLNLQGGIEAWSQEVDPSIPRY